MLKIQRASNGKIVFSLSGRVEPEDLDELRRLLAVEVCPPRIVLNLKELLLLGRDAVQFLGECEAAGMTLDDCPGYVRKWIDLGRNGA